MVINENVWNVANRLHSTRDDNDEAVNHIISGADEIYDDEKGKKQSQINTETYNYIQDVNSALAGLSPEQAGAMGVSTKANNNEAKLGYYVCNSADNEQKSISPVGYVLSNGGSIKIKMVNANTINNVTVTLNINSTGAKPLYYNGEAVSAINTWEAGEVVEVYYDSSFDSGNGAYFANNVAGGSGNGDGAFDISMYNKTMVGGVVTPAPYSGLRDALTVGMANVPQSKKKGGMSVKFVQSSDNKYVQYRLMTQSFTTDVTQWAVCSDTILVQNSEFIKVDTDKDNKILWAIKLDGTIYYGAGVPPQVVDYIQQKIAELSLDEYEDIVAFLNGLEEGDKTLQQLFNEKASALEVNEALATKVNKEEGKSLIPTQYIQEQEYPSLLRVITDAQDKIIEVIDLKGNKKYYTDVELLKNLSVDGNFSVGGSIHIDGEFSSSSGKGLSTNDYTDVDKTLLATFSLIDDPIWRQVTVDSNGRIVEGIKKSGERYIGQYDENIEAVLSDVTDYNFIKKQESADVEKKLIPYTRATPTEDIDYNVGYNLLTLAFMTDTHIDLGDAAASYANVIDTINFLNNTKVPITALLEGGDVITPAFLSKDGYLDALRRFFVPAKKIKIPLLYTKGNHDLNAIGGIPASAIGDDDDWSNVYFDYAEQNYGIVRNLKSNGKKSGYYYYDIPQYKVRIIAVNCYDIDFSIRKQDTTVNYYPGSSDYIANEQFNWIASTALNFDDKDEKDWGVIVLVHNYNPTDVGTNQEPVYESATRKFNTMLDAFNSQSTFDEEYTFQHSWFDLDVHADWTRYANIEDKPYLICVLCGHLHADLNYNYSGVQCIKTANQFCGESSTDRRVRRIAGTSTQNLFDLFTFDLVHKKIRAIRYGAGKNCYGNNGDRFLPNGLSF